MIYYNSLIRAIICHDAKCMIDLHKCVKTFPEEMGHFLQQGFQTGVRDTQGASRMS